MKKNQSYNFTRDYFLKNCCTIAYKKWMGKLVTEKMISKGIGFCINEDINRNVSYLRRL